MYENVPQKIALQLKMLASAALNNQRARRIATAGAQEAGERDAAR